MKLSLVEEFSQILNNQVRNIEGEEHAIIIWNAAIEASIRLFIDSRRYDGYSIYKMLKELKK